MGDNLDNSTEIERRLRALTQRQCQILYLVCQGMSYKQITSLIGYGQDLVQKEMSQAYRVLGLGRLSRDKKRRQLIEEICPIHLKLVSDPETDCSQRVIEVNEPEPDPEMLEEVKEDAERGLIPLNTALIPVDTALIPKPREEPADGSRGRRGPSQRPSSRLPWIVAGILGVLLIGALYLLFTQQSSKNSAPTAVTDNVVRTAQPSQAAAPSLMASAPLPTSTLLPTQVPYTPLPTQVPYTPLPTPTSIVVVATVAPTTMTPMPNSAVQNPPPGSMVAAGQSYDYSGLSIYSSTQAKVDGNQILVQVFVRNNRNQSYTLRYTADIFHLKDDTGKQYPLSYVTPSELREIRNMTIEPNQAYSIVFQPCCGLFFMGPIAVNARYLVLTIDQAAGMTNLNWQFDLR